MLLLGTTQAYGQENQVRGQIIDESGEALIGASVLVEGEDRGTITDFNGNFTIAVADGQTLLVRYLGYADQRIIVDGQRNLEITMELDATAFDEVVITAFGSVKKEDFVGSAVQLNSEDLQGRALTNVSQALDGIGPGVQVSPGSGQPGSGPNIRVRGIGSISSSNAPLYVVDGAVFSGNLSSLNSNDIETITVLKDAASTSLYGSGASNGVVMITTKRGQAGTDRINLNISHGISTRSVPEYSRVGPQDYYVLMWEALRNSKVSAGIEMPDANMQASAEIYDVLGYNPFNVANDQLVSTDGVFNPDASLRYSYLDWEDELRRTAYRSNIDLSYSGGNNKTTYFASAGYLTEDAYIINSDFERITGRVGVDTRARDWLKFGVNLAGSFSNSKQAVDGAANSASFVNPFRSVRVMAPIYPVFLHDPVTGELVLDSQGNKIYDSGDIFELRAPGSPPGRHAIQENILNIDTDINQNLNTRAYVEFSFLNNFKFTSNVGFDRRYYNRERLQNAVIGDAAPSGRGFRTSSNTTAITFNQLLEYINSFGFHNVGVLVGHENLDYTFNFLTGTRQDQVVEGNTELVNFVNVTNLNSYQRELRREGYFTRLNYNYDDRYYVSASFRRDGSSRFAPDVRWGNFWSVGGAWRIDREEFARNIPILSDLKLRASYGQVGNDANLSHGILSFYAFQALASLGNNNANEAGALLNTAGNSDLTWESNNQFDVALEFSAFNNRLRGEIEYFIRESDGLILNVPLPVSAGFDNVPRNIGAMQNSGVELFLTGDVVRNNDWLVSLSLSATTYKNEITSLPQDEIITGTKKLVEGGDIFAYWLREWYGVDPSDGSALYVPTETAIEAAGDDIREIDGRMLTTNLTNAEFDFVGTAIPDWYGSIGARIGFKRFTLNSLLAYQIGGKTYDSNFATLMSSGTYGRATSSEALNRWKEPGDVTDVPRMDASKTSDFDGASSRWLVSSSYFAIRQLSLSYDMPRELINSWGIDALRLYVNAENVFAFTERKGLEPTQNFNGTTQNRFTPARIVSVGANLTF